jgi:hypothetical protein
MSGKIIRVYFDKVEQILQRSIKYNINKNIPAVYAHWEETFQLHRLR